MKGLLLASTYPEYVIYAHYVIWAVVIILSFI